VAGAILMDAGYQRRRGAPGRREGTAVRHAASEHTPDPSGYDAELRRHNQVLRWACGVQLHDHVLDIGCGTGQTAREAGRTAQAGSALGVDISAPAIERAREIARAEGLGNVTFEHANAQVHRFPPERFDLAISRFGTMSFDDPVAAFANIRRALRPAGRLVMVWQPFPNSSANLSWGERLCDDGGAVSLPRQRSPTGWWGFPLRRCEPGTGAGSCRSSTGV